MKDNDTIAAICSGVGGAVTVIRVSGKDALRAVAAVWSASSPLESHPPRTLVLGVARPLGAETGEPALAVFMPAPRSYTGEDVVELHAHGGNLNARLLLQAILASGFARHAAPGEFTYRAFLNGKLDLTQAEAVADLIASHSQLSVKMAERQMGGALGAQIRTLRQSLLDLLADCESRSDFPEESIDFEKPEALASRIDHIASALQALHDTRRDGAVLREGIRIVIAGRPNTGKSSLLNLLLGYDRAITSETPGTTRDTIEEDVTLRGIPVTLVDTAGLREATDAIEAFGIERTIKSIASSQIVLWLMDASAPNLEEELSDFEKLVTDRNHAIAVWNKTDLLENPSRLPDAVSDIKTDNCAKNKKQKHHINARRAARMTTARLTPDGMATDQAAEMLRLAIPTIRLSVLRQSGIEELLDALEKIVWGAPHHEAPEIAVSARHAGLLATALDAIPEARNLVSHEQWELAAVPLRAALAALGDIVGEGATFDIYDTIFSKFCVGK